MKKNLLIISPVAFHNKVGQAGHKSINYYISKFCNDFTVTVLSIVDIGNSDFKLMVQDHPYVKFIGNKRMKKFYERIIDYLLFRYIYPFLKLRYPKYYISNGFHERRLKNILDSIADTNQFDYVLVEFTSMILQINLLKRYFITAKFIAVCHDVSFLSVERWLKYHYVLINKKRYYLIFKKIEIEALNFFDLVVTLNSKDADLLKCDSSFLCQKLHIINVYFDTYNVIETNPDGIVFFGAMSRNENIESIKWFLNTVWKEILKLENITLKLYIVGGGASADFIKYCSGYDHVVVTGFVNDPTVYFNKSYTMIIPLLMGAGIKVKTIEALASGIPVLCNSIGIEGIPAKIGVDYLYCDDCNSWIDAILKVINSKETRLYLTKNSRKFVKENFDLEKSYVDYKNVILSM